jgi:hypothetical protein
VGTESRACYELAQKRLTNAENLNKLIERADERTRTADLSSLRVITQGLQGLAGGCKFRISKRLSLLRVAACCTLLRSRWYQSGINTVLLSTFE